MTEDDATNPFFSYYSDNLGIHLVSPPLTGPENYPSLV